MILDKIGEARQALQEGNPGAPENKGVAFLMIAVSAVVAIFTALGITGGVAGRMARNEELLVMLALGCAVLAAVLGVIAAPLSKPEQARKQAVLLWAGLALFVLAAGFAIGAAVRTWNEDFAPRVTASLESTPRGDVIVVDSDASGLEAHQRLTTAIWPVGGIEQGGFSPTGEILRDEFRYKVAGPPLYRAINGPNSDGDVDLAARVPVPSQHPGLVVVRAAVESDGEPSLPSDCFDQGAESGCITLDLGRPGPPQIDASWESIGDETLLAVKVGAEQVTGQRVQFRVFGRAAGGSKKLARAEIPPTATGAIARELSVGVPEGVKSVCVAASTVPTHIETTPVTGCPPTFHADHESIQRCIEVRARDEAPEVADGAEPTPRSELRKSCREGFLKSAEESAAWLKTRAPG